jgi:hypothetical protein
MEVAVDEHLMQRAPQEGLGEGSPVETQLLDAINLARTHPVQPLHHQNLRRGQLLVDAGNANPWHGFEQRCDLGGVAGLDAKIELLTQTVGELGDNSADAVLGGPPGAGLGHAGKLGRHVEVALDGLDDAGPLHLDDHRLARAQLRLVGLTDGGRGDGLPVELGEQLARGLAQLFGQGLLDGSAGCGLDVVLEA